MTSAPGQWPGHSALVVPIPALEAFVRARHAHYDAAYVSADPSFAHAHVTVLAPFVSPAELGDGLRPARPGHCCSTLGPSVGPDDVAGASERLAMIAAATEPFDVTFSSVATFPDGIIHLVPEPAQELRGLTRAVCAAFPGLLPYAGAHGPGPDAVAPHLTLDAVGEQITEDRVRSWVEPLLPLHQRVDRLQISWYEPWRCHTVATWQLGPDRTPTDHR